MTNLTVFPSLKNGSERMYWVILNRSVTKQGWVALATRRNRVLVAMET